MVTNIQLTKIRVINSNIKEKTIEKYNQLNNIKNFIKKEEPKYMGTTTSQSEF